MFTLEEVVPWGRSFDEYRLMLALSDLDLGLRILGCGDGPASFNAIASRRGASVCSCDPLHRFSADEIRRLIAATYPTMMDQTRQNAGQFVWHTISSIEQLGRVRMSAMEDFLSDYRVGKREGRYAAAELAALPFPDAAFDLALCAHFLFLYSVQLREEFHCAAVLEMSRVAAECRIFPLLALDGQPSPFVDSVLDVLRDAGLEAALESVPFLKSMAFMPPRPPNGSGDDSACRSHHAMLR